MLRVSFDIAGRITEAAVKRGYDHSQALAKDLNLLSLDYKNLHYPEQNFILTTRVYS